MYEHQDNIERLAREFGDIPEALIREHYERIVSGYAGAPIRAYIPVLALKDTRNALRMLGHQKTNGRGPE